MRPRIRHSSFALLSCLLACQPHTTRPPFPPVTGAPEVELELTPARATELLAEAFRAEGLPVGRVVVRDAWLETPWFDAASLRPTDARRLGPDVVRVRAWADPTRPRHSRVTVETLFRPLADPSLPERELDRQVPPDHPVAKRVQAALNRLVDAYGEPAPARDTTASPSPASPGEGTKPR
ncbi:MAG TPA: hypothetical protein VNK43_05115 [Gemmatimonadales bacterium]|nr:hypothetical protein [Gemmatimonadales bacterium]